MNWGGKGGFIEPVVMFALVGAGAVWLVYVAGRKRAGHYPPFGDTIGGLLILSGVGFAVIHPVIMGASEKPRMRSCLSNVKQVGTSFLMYMQDFDERMPIAAGWNDSLQPYVKNHDIFRCPTAKSPYGYAYNSGIQQVEEKRIKIPQNTVALFESDADNINAFGGPERMIPTSRHEGKFTIGFADGHAAYYSKGESIRWMP